MWHHVACFRDVTRTRRGLTLTPCGIPLSPWKPTDTSRTANRCGPDCQATGRAGPTAHRETRVDDLFRVKEGGATPLARPLPLSVDADNGSHSSGLPACTPVFPRLCGVGVGSVSPHSPATAEPCRASRAELACRVANPAQPALRADTGSRASAPLSPSSRAEGPVSEPSPPVQPGQSGHRNPLSNGRRSRSAAIAGRSVMVITR
jgi:hypothetical protein